MTTKTKGKPAKHLTPKQTDELKKLAESARQIRGAHYGKDKAEDSQKYTKLLQKYLDSGVSYKELSEVTGLKWRSIKARLQRHGVLPLPPSQQNKRFQGPKQAGPKCQHDPDRFRKRVDKKTQRVTHIECLDCRRNKRMVNSAS